MLVCGGEGSMWKDRILLRGGADTSGTEPDHALWWKRDVSLHARKQYVHVVHKALPMERRRWPGWSQAWQPVLTGTGYAVITRG